MPLGYNETMETWDAIRARRNVRAYEDRPIEGVLLDRILEAGWRSPSAINWQPWDFVVVTERSTLQRLSVTGPGSGHLAGAAAAVALVAPIRDDERREWVQFDLGQAAFSIMLAAADLGVGSGHASMRDEHVTQEVLGYPEDRFCPYLIALGYPAGRPLTPIARPKRRPFEEVVHRSQW